MNSPMRSLRYNQHQPSKNTSLFCLPDIRAFTHLNIKSYILIEEGSEIDDVGHRHTS